MQQEMVDLKAQLQTQCEQLKIDLQDEATRAACKECTTCPKTQPNPIKSLLRSQSSLIAPATPVHLEIESNQPTPLLFSIDGDEMQHARMLINSAPEAEDTNSPTPTADIPLTVPTVAPTVDNPLIVPAVLPIADPVLTILVATQKQMEQTDAHLKAIKTGTN
jgi:hypothetical protein